MRCSGSSEPTARASRPSSGSSRAYSSRRPGPFASEGAWLALLGLGVDFHQELTGRENIYLGAALFGFTTREIRALESSIIEFAELGQFIDVPVKNYSSGMQVRLGFSIALEVTPDVFPDRRGAGRGGRAFQAEVPETAQERAEDGADTT